MEWILGFLRIWDDYWCWQSNSELGKGFNLIRIFKLERIFGYISNFHGSWLYYYLNLIKDSRCNRCYREWVVLIDKLFNIVAIKCSNLEILSWTSRTWILNTFHREFNLDTSGLLLAKHSCHSKNIKLTLAMYLLLYISWNSLKTFFVHVWDGQVSRKDYHKLRIDA